MEIVFILMIMFSFGLFGIGIGEIINSKQKTKKLKALRVCTVSRSFIWLILMVVCGLLMLVGGKIALLAITGVLICGIQCAYLMALGK